MLEVVSEAFGGLDMALTLGRENAASEELDMADGVPLDKKVAQHKIAILRTDMGCGIEVADVVGVADSSWH